MRVAGGPARVVPPLTGVLARAMPWRPLLAVAPVVPALAVLFQLTEHGLPPETASALLRAGGLLLGAAAALLLADEMAGSTGAVPSPRWLRQWLRTGLALPAAAVAWAGGYAVVARLAADRAPPLPDTAVPAAGCLLLGLAGAAVAVRRVPEQHGAAAGAALLAVLFVASLLVPDEWSPWPDPAAPSGDAVHTGWVVAGLVSVAVLAVAHRDTR